jgi:hypothetical protein
MSFLARPNYFANSNSHQSEEQEHEDEQETEKEKWIPHELTSRKRLREELGEPQPRKVCFGCVYESCTESVRINNFDFKQLCLVASKCVGQMSLEAYGEEIAMYFAKFREDTNKNGLHEDGRPIPPWSASSIVEHLLYHNVDPEIQTWVRLIEIQEMIRTCSECIFEYNDKLKKMRVNKEASLTYERLVKLWYHVTSRPLDKQFGYRKSSKIDMDSINQPFITKNQKSIVDYYKEAQSSYI